MKKYSSSDKSQLN